jgi:general transcription factor 3C polypeptide 3 (transcription factor C subunit 4)
MTGIVDLAVKHYEKVLEMAAEQKTTGEMGKMDGAETTMQQQLDLSREAAYNLSSIYYTRGAPDLARQVVDRYLSL